MIILRRDPHNLEFDGQISSFDFASWESPEELWGPGPPDPFGFSLSQPAFTSYQITNRPWA